MKEYLLFYDSGVGGVSILKECINLLPNENYIYFVQNKFAPLGNKKKTEIIKIVCDDILMLSTQYNLKGIILACNTATSVAISELRKIYNIKIYGVEPAILPALRSDCKKILVLCTLATFKNNKVIQSNKQNSRLIFHKSKSFARLIDDNIDNLDEILPKIKNELNKYENMNIDGIVLGCTHYSFIKPQIQKLFKKDLIFFEPCGGVCDNIFKNTKSSKGKLNVKIKLANKNFKFKHNIINLIKKP